MNNILTEILSKQDLIETLCKKYSIIFLGIFGSSVRGEAKHESDIDILVTIEKRITALDFVGLEYELSEIIGKKVDLVERIAVHPMLKERIENEVIPIYECRR